MLNVAVDVTPLTVRSDRSVCVYWYMEPSSCFGHRLVHQLRACRRSAAAEERIAVLLWNLTFIMTLVRTATGRYVTPFKTTVQSQAVTLIPILLFSPLTHSTPHSTPH
jgi:hypothetical protein